MRRGYSEVESIAAGSWWSAVSSRGGWASPGPGMVYCATTTVMLSLPPLYLSRRGMRRFHESRIVLQLSGRKQAVILIVTSRKEEHHGLVSRAVDRGRATRRQRGTVLSSQPPNSRKDARALVVAHRAHASACGQGCRSQSGHRPAIRGRVSAGGLGRLAAVESQSPGEPGPRRGGPPIAS